MNGTGAMIISGTILIIAIYLILTRQGGGPNAGNAFTQVFSSVGAQYTSVVKALMGK